MPDPGFSLKVVRMNDAQLRDLIVQRSRLTGRTVKDETRTVFKGMVKDGFAVTPPGTKQAGEAAIARDLHLIGFVPVTIKGFRMVTEAFGRPIEPVKVPTRINPRFDDPDAIHLARLQSKHGGKVTRGGKQAWYVDKRKFSALKTRLFKQVGTLASWLVPAARALGVPVPAWISRHGESGRGSQLQVRETETSISMRVTGHFPATAGPEAAATQRRLEYIKKVAIGKLIRQLPFLLKRKK